MCLKINVSANIHVHRIIGNDYVFGTKTFRVEKNKLTSFYYPQYPRDNITYSISKEIEGIKLTAPLSSQLVSLVTNSIKYSDYKDKVCKDVSNLHDEVIINDLGMHFNAISLSNISFYKCHRENNDIVKNLIVCSNVDDIQIISDNNNVITKCLYIPHPLLISEHISQINFPGYKINEHDTLIEEYKKLYEEELCALT